MKTPHSSRSGDPRESVVRTPSGGRSTDYPRGNIPCAGSKDERLLWDYLCQYYEIACENHEPPRLYKDPPPYLSFESYFTCVLEIIRDASTGNQIRTPLPWLYLIAYRLIRILEKAPPETIEPAARKVTHWPVLLKPDGHHINEQLKRVRALSLVKVRKSDREGGTQTKDQNSSNAPSAKKDLFLSIRYLATNIRPLAPHEHELVRTCSRDREELFVYQLIYWGLDRFKEDLKSPKEPEIAAVRAVTEKYCRELSAFSRAQIKEFSSKMICWPMMVSHPTKPVHESVKEYLKDIQLGGAFHLKTKIESGGRPIGNRKTHELIDLTMLYFEMMRAANLEFHDAYDKSASSKINSGFSSFRGNPGKNHQKQIIQVLWTLFQRLRNRKEVSKDEINLLGEANAHLKLQEETTRLENCLQGQIKRIQKRENGPGDLDWKIEYAIQDHNVRVSNLSHSRNWNELGYKKFVCKRFAARLNSRL